MALYWASSDFLCLGQMALVLLVGARRVSSGMLSVGTLVAFLSYVQMYIWPVRQMGRVLADLGKSMVSLGRIQEIFAEPRESNPAQSPAHLPARMSGEIILTNVSFSHSGRKVLDQISLHIRPGETVALLGPSGAGKSTLVNLLLRFYEYDCGSITVDGHDIKDLDRKYLRSQFGVVMQEPFLYSKTLRDNIKLGRHESADADVVDAATMAAVHDSIEAFEKKYDTLVGERGVTLSGGQRQRVAIARALRREAPILILDDALSAIDTRTETMILDALNRRRHHQTTLIIAHRLSTLMRADRIVVLEKGQITQVGTHHQLLQHEGLYRQLWQIQSALEEDLSRELRNVPGEESTSLAARTEG
jgi:ATP-binding cassette subfamily B protein